MADPTKNEPAPATIQQLEAAFPGREKFVMDTLRSGCTMAQAYEKFPAFVKAENDALAADVAKKDARIKELESLGREGNAGSAVAGGGQGGAGGDTQYKTFAQAVTGLQAANPKMSKGEATREAGRQFPHLYAAAKPLDNSRHESIPAGFKV